MSTGTRFEALFKHRVAAAMRRQRAVVLARTLAVSGTAVLLAALVLRIFLGGSVVSTVAWGWLASVGVACSFWFLRPRNQQLLRRDVAGAIDREHAAGGAALAASWVLEGRTRSRLGAVVLRDADNACVDLGRRGSPPFPTTWLGVALGLLCLSLLVPTLPSLLGGGGRGMTSATPPAGGGLGASPPPVSGSGAGVVGVGAATERPDLSELARFEIRTDHRIYLIGEEIRLTAALRPLADAGGDVPLDVVVGVTDGLPSEDVGFGAGVHPIRAPWDWSFPEAGDEPLEGHLQLKTYLENFQIYKVGLITIEAWVASRGDGTSRPVRGGLASNQITIQIAENRKRQRVRKPEPVAKKRTPKKLKSDPKKEEKDRGRRGRNKPELGDPDRLKAAQRKKKAVKPLLSDGPTVDKEVIVFEREQGGDAPPPPAKRTLADSPARTFIKREEHAVERIGLSPLDRRLVKSYWDAVMKKK
ncbi:MAG: hypothetical protein HRU14_05630 [Planctomycetes bacterium]|nr:hypothetical protein [Planctomycetota bacterium]